MWLNCLLFRQAQANDTRLRGSTPTLALILTETMEINNVYQYAWLSTYQLIISPEGDRKCKDLVGWGSGFFLSHKGRYFFVTADHNLHMRDHEEGERTGAENHLFIHNNITDQEKMAPILTPMGNFYFFDRYDYSHLFDSETNPEDVDAEVLAIPDLIDIAFCEVQKNIERPFLTHELAIEESVLVPAGEQKIIIPSEMITEPSEDCVYLVEGVVQNEIKGLRNLRRNAIHQDLTYAGSQYGDYLFDYPNVVKHEEWAAISGAPLFDNQCRLVGMVVQVNEHTNQIQVVPASKIVSLIEQQLKVDNFGKLESSHNEKETSME